MAMVQATARVIPWRWPAHKFGFLILDGAYTDAVFCSSRSYMRDGDEVIVKFAPEDQFAEIVVASDLAVEARRALLAANEDPGTVAAFIEAAANAQHFDVSNDNSYLQLEDVTEDYENYKRRHGR